MAASLMKAICLSEDLRGILVEADDEPSHHLHPVLLYASHARQ